MGRPPTISGIKKLARYSLPKIYNLEGQLGKISVLHSRIRYMYEKHEIKKVNFKREKQHPLA